jgi:hypothetical protein
VVHAFGTEPAHLNTWVTHPPFVWLPAGPVTFALAGQIVLLRKLLGQPSGEHVQPVAGHRGVAEPR